MGTSTDPMPSAHPAARSRSEAALPADLVQSFWDRVELRVRSGAVGGLVVGLERVLRGVRPRMRDYREAAVRLPR